MLPIFHIIYSFLFSIFFYAIFPNIGLLGLVIIFSSSILIDIDHYFYYIFKKRDLNLIRAYDYFFKIGIKYKNLPESQRKKISVPICVFHGIEVLLIFFLLSRYIPLIFFLFLGFIIHLFFDLIYSIYSDTYFHKLSLIYEFIRSRKLKSIDDVK